IRRCDGGASASRPVKPRQPTADRLLGEGRENSLSRGSIGVEGTRPDALTSWSVLRWEVGDAREAEITEYHLEGPMPQQKLPPVHPGEVLLEEFLGPLEISQYRLAKDLSVPPRRINEIVRGSRAISADTALRLARYFGTSERFWLNL